MRSNCFSKNKLVFVISSKLSQKTRTKHCSFFEKLCLVSFLATTRYLLMNRQRVVQPIRLQHLQQYTSTFSLILDSMNKQFETMTYPSQVLEHQSQSSLYLKKTFYFHRTLCNIIARKIISSTSGFDDTTAAPIATPSAEQKQQKTLCKNKAFFIYKLLESSLQPSRR